MGSVALVNSRQESFGLEALAGQYVAVYFSAHWVRCNKTILSPLYQSMHMQSSLRIYL
jgi:hypothetical protein